MHLSVGDIVHNVAGEGWLPVVDVPLAAIPMWVLGSVPDAEVTRDPGVTLDGIASKFTDDEHASLGDLADAIASKWADRRLVVLSVVGADVFGLVKANDQFFIAKKSFGDTRCESCAASIA